MTTLLEKDEKKHEVQLQLDSVMPQIRAELQRKLDKAMISGAIPEAWMEENNWYLAKTIINSFCKDKPYLLMDKKITKEANNLHLFI